MLFTTIGCLAYERLAKNLSYFTVGSLVCLSYIPFACGAFWLNNDIAHDRLKFWGLKWWIIVYILSGVTSPLWYFITRQQSVLAGATYEFKYIVVLAFFYALFGDNKMSWNMVLGLALAVLSVYFVSKS